MKTKGKLIWTFIITFIIILLVVNMLTRTYVLPISPARLAAANMQPAYEKGDVLFIKKTNDYAVGDVVLMKVNSHTIVTRITNVNADETYSAKGDANPGQLLQEKSFTKDNIVGEVVAKTSPGIFYLILYFIQLLVAALITWGIYRVKFAGKK